MLYFCVTIGAVNYTSIRQQLKNTLADKFLIGVGIVHWRHFCEMVGPDISTTKIPGPLCGLECISNRYYS